MAAYFTLTLDTTAPANPSISLEGGATYATQQLINATIGTSDSPTTNYQMLIWGDVDNTENANIQTTEGSSSWITYSTSQQVKLSSGDESKTIYLKIRDNVYNVSSQASDSITLDTDLPTVTIGTPDATVISKQTGKNESTFTWQASELFDEYKIKAVPATGSPHDAGTQIPTTDGSSNMSGNAGDYPAGTNITSKIKGTDLETASAGDGAKIVKVFVKDKSGQWSA